MRGAVAGTLNVAREAGKNAYAAEFDNDGAGNE